MAKITNNDLAQAIYDAIKGKSESEQKEVFQKTARFIAMNNLLSRVPLILESLKKIINSREGKMSARIVSKEKLPTNTREQVIKILSERYGKKVELEEEIDSRVLGGWRIEAEDEIIDLSLKNKLAQLQEHLTTAL